MLLVLVSAWVGAGCSAAADDLLEERRPVSGFHSVKASISGRIDLERGAEESLVIEARQATLERLVTEVEDGVLLIRQEPAGGWWRDSGPIRIRISYRQLDALELSGSADVQTDAISSEAFAVTITGSSNVDVPALTVESLRVRVSGSGDLDVRELDAEVVKLGVSGSGDVQLTGKATDLEVAVNGSGDVDGAALESRQAVVAVSGSGDVEVWATEDLEVQISGSGNVEYRGEPALTSRVLGSGELKKR